MLMRGEHGSRTGAIQSIPSPRVQARLDGSRLCLHHVLQQQKSSVCYWFARERRWFPAFNSLPKNAGKLQTPFSSSSPTIDQE